MSRHLRPRRRLGHVQCRPLPSTEAQQEAAIAVPRPSLPSLADTSRPVGTCPPHQTHAQHALQQAHCLDVQAPNCAMLLISEFLLVRKASRKNGFRTRQVQSSRKCRNTTKGVAYLVRAIAGVLCVKPSFGTCTSSRVAKLPFRAAATTVASSPYRRS